ncbi:MAG: hypothetical protein ACYSXF_01440, partial [Planctomycetota bacterium]
MSDDSERWYSVFACSLAVAGALVLVTIASGQTPQSSQTRARARLDVGLPTEAELKAVEIGPDLRRLVQQLDAPSYAVREEAMGRCSRGACDRLQPHALLAGPGLSAEQRHRLVIVLREQLLESPRGAVGIRFNRAPHRMEGIVVDRVAVLIPDRALDGELHALAGGTLLDGHNELGPGLQEVAVEARQTVAHQ